MVPFVRQPARTARPARPVLPACAIALLCLAAAPSAHAERVTVVLSSKAGPYRQAEAALTARLARAGHTTRSVLLADVVAEPAELRRGETVYVAVGTRAMGWLGGRLPATSRLVYCMVSEAPDRHDGALVGGVSTRVPLDAQFALIRRALPKTRVLGMLHRSTCEVCRKRLRAVRAALPAGWKLIAEDVEDHGSVAAAIAALLARDPDIVWTAPEASLYNVAAVRSLLLAAIRKGKPVFGFSLPFVRAGALLGVGIDPGAQGAQGAEVVLEVLRGGGEAPTTRPNVRLRPRTRHQEAVNLTVARKLGIELPEKVVRSADKVFGKKTEGKK